MSNIKKELEKQFDTKNRRNSNDSDNDDNKMIVDLDTIIEKYVQWAWESHKPKHLAKYDFDDLDIVVDWKRVKFEYDEPKFEQAPKNFAPKNQTLFRTFFTNNTDLEQDYSFKTERTTRQSCTFSFNKGFSREKEGGFKFALPNDILELAGGLRESHSLEFGKDTTKEDEVKWGVDNVIRVPPHTRATAELVLTEHQYEKKFSIDVKISGTLSIVINSKKENGLFLKRLGCDMGEMIDLAMENRWITRVDTIFKILRIKGEKTTIAVTTLKGSCNFRVGVSQHVTLKQEPTGHKNGIKY